MTTVYFVRHAQADNSVRDGRNRPLTEKGITDRLLITEFLADKKIDAVFSSPFKRAVDTLGDFAVKYGFDIKTVEDFRERKSDSDMSRRNLEFESFMERQWADFSYTYSDGECLAEVQRRNIAALNGLLAKNAGNNIVIGTHGTALGTIINHYDGVFGYADFCSMVNKLPWVVRMIFDETRCVEINKYW